MLHSVKRVCKIPLLLLLLVIPVLFACKKLDLKKITTSGEWNPNLAVPIAYKEFGVKDILARTDSSDLVVVNPSTGEIALVYKGTLFSYEADHFVSISDFNFLKNSGATDLGGAPAPSFNGTLTETTDEIITVPVNSGVEINTMQIRQGTLSLRIVSNFKHNVQYKVTFPELTINGVPVSRTVNLNYSGSLPVENTLNIDLSSAQGNFTDGTDYNKLKVKLNATLTGTGNEITGSEQLSVQLGFSSVRFENIIGYFGQQDVGLANDSIVLKLFRSLTEGHFQLVNPKVNFIIENSFGFPVKLTFNEIKTINIQDAATYILTNYAKVHTISRPSSLGETSITNISFNVSNTGNLTQLISPVPKYFYFDVNALSNPSGKTASPNFLDYRSKINVKTLVELPLEGFAYGFQLKDTVNFNFSNDVSNIDKLMFRIIVNNGFPVEIKTTLVFVDQNYVPLFTIFDTPEALVESAPVDASGRVTKRSKKITDFTLTKEQLALIDKADKIIIKTYGQTLLAQNNKVVKFFDDCGINVKLAMQVKGKI